MSLVIRAIALAPLLALLSACGGTSDSGSQPAQHTRAGAASNSATSDYTIGGTVTGLSGHGLMLQISDGSELPIAANGAFTFPGALPSGTAYSITIKSQPTVQHEICAITNGSGTVGTTDIGNVSVNCTIALGFVYVTDPNSVIGVYGISPGTGALIPDGAFAEPTNGNEAYAEPTALVAAPSGKFLYLLTWQPYQIATFSIDPNQGALTAVNAPVVAADATAMVISPNGSFLFVVDKDNSGNENVQTFTVDSATGALTAASTLQPCSCSGGVALAVTPDSKYLYISYRDDMNVTIVTPYAIDAMTGGLKAGAGIILPPSVLGGGYSCCSMAIDPLGRFLYLGFSNIVNNSLGIVVPYTIDPMSGALTDSTPSSVVPGLTPGVVPGNPQSLAPDPTGKYLYAIDNFEDNNVASLAVDPSSGALSLIGSAVDMSAALVDGACDPSGAFLFVTSFPATHLPATQSWSDLYGFTIANNGANTGVVSASGEGLQFAFSDGGYNLGIFAIVE
jgi:6-phosphogluconolactonase (cycloisomerase 2 family)